MAGNGGQSRPRNLGRPTANAQFNVSVTAQKDLDDLWDYYAEAESEAVADRIVDRLYRNFQLLAEYPYMARQRPEYSPDMRGYNVPGTPYVVFYYPADAGIEIARVVHGRRDLGRLFR